MRPFPPRRGEFAVVLNFTKMEGCGNDYIYVDCLAGLFFDPAAAAVALSPRHFAVGADGLICICHSDVADAKMRMFNADGSEGSMCGNGIRCVAQWLFEHGLVTDEAKVETRAGVKTLRRMGDGMWQVEMGKASFVPADLPAQGFGDDVLRVSGSCGVGTLKGWNGKKAIHIDPVSERRATILAYGPVRTVVEMAVKGWKYGDSYLNMTCRYTLYGGHRDAEVEVLFDAPLGNEVFCTGVQDIKGSQSYSDHKGLIACWGTDWPVNDTIKYAKETVGLATYLPAGLVVGEKKDKSNYLYQISAPGATSIRYYINFTSMKETFGYKTPEAWFSYVESWRKELENPCRVAIKPRK